MKVEKLNVWYFGDNGHRLEMNNTIGYKSSTLNNIMKYWKEGIVISINFAFHTL